MPPRMRVGGCSSRPRLIRDRFYADQEAGLQQVLPVVLPGGSAGDLPLWLFPASTTHYPVTGYTVAGAEALLRVLTGQPRETVPGLGAVPGLPPRGTGPAVTGAAGAADAGSDRGAG